ncbi:hypothetical protein [Mycobacterium sp. 1274756.6]|uniref:hypothetical protein n=1 Tax=Mycobacterium sp. 1274756.6 TaxID=1834076 RepID=UPI0007FC6B8A|nr:hypothetical protein [Mycobacterium sp. 1274756.6]OBJ73561.1 hypothetical protein A5643_03165 [Mycobacterium sp. 1274756.6]
MLIIALVLAVIGLAALVFAVVTSNAVVAWVCIGASLLGVLLLTADAVRDRRRRTASAAEDEHPDIAEDDEGILEEDDLADADETEDVAEVTDTADAEATDGVEESSAETAETDRDE